MSILDDLLKEAGSTESGQEILREGRSELATRGEKIRYGMEKATWMIPDAVRWVQAGGDKELLKAREERRTGKLAARFQHLSQEDKESGWAMAGEIGVDVFDPAFLATGYVGATAKVAKLGNAARRLTSGALWGGVSAGDALIHQVSKGDDVNPTMVGVAGLAGGTLGLVLPAKGAVNAITSKGPKGDIKTLASQEVNSVVPDSNAETMVRQALQAYESGDSAAVSALQSSRTNGELLDWADNIYKLHRREARNRTKGRKGAYDDKSWAALEAHKKSADEIYERFPEMLAETAEGGASGIMGGMRKLRDNDNLNSNTVRTLVYRPLIGAGAGFGIGATLNLYDDDTTYSPWLFAAVGAIGGAVSKKIVASKFSQEIKDAATGEIQNVMRRSLWTQANILVSGTMAARGNAFGGKLETLTKAITSQRGADLKGAAGVSLEEAKEIALQEVNRRWNYTFRDLGLLGHKKNIVTMREDAYKLSEGFITLDDLVAKGYTQVEINTIESAGKAGIALVKSVTDEVRRVGMHLEQDLEGYVLPQIHDLAKIRANPEQARAAYIRSFIQQQGAKTPEEVAGATKNANEFFLDMMTGKKGGGRRLDNAFDMKGGGAEGDAAYLHTTPMRPLANHFEKARMFNKFEARKEIQDFLVTDIDKLMKMYTHNSVPIIEFARMFGSGKSTFKEFAGLKGGQLTAAEKSGSGKDGILLMKEAIHKDFEAARAVEGISLREIKALNKVERQQMKTVHDMVNGYFGMLHADSFGSNATMGNTLMSFFITGANTTMLTKVTISSLGDIVQPFQNSGFFNALKGYRRSFGKKRDFAEKTGFADTDVLEHELQSYILQQNNPSSRVQAGLRAANQFYFRAIGLGKLTSFARRFAYNTGVEDAFKIAKDISKKSTSSLVTRGNNLGLDDISIGILNKFDNVEAAFADEGAKRILNIAGRKTADRDALIPQLGNRRGFAQSRNPYVKSLGQFLSWAQAKTTQTNALIHRMENGDDALFVRMLGLIAIYDGVLTFKDFLGDPTGKRLEDKDEDNYLQRLTSLEQIAKSSNFGGNYSHWFIDKMSRLMSAHGNSHPSEDLVPAISYAMDLYEAFSPAVGDTQGTVWKNLMRGDDEGAALQTLKRLPFGRDINAWLGVLDNELVDEASPLPKRSRIRNAIGGEVEDVPRVPKEPDERIDKLTGRPYNEQAGGAFIDAEDPLRRLGFVGGGLADNPIRRLGFNPGGLILSKLITKGVSSPAAKTVSRRSSTVAKEGDNILIRAAREEDKAEFAAKAQKLGGPSKTVKGYKLFSTKKGSEELFPLYIYADEPVKEGVWVKAKEGIRKGEKVKSKIGELSYRPGWHSADSPTATHIGGRSSIGLTTPDYRPAHQRWAEVEVADDFNWQKVADAKASKTGEGKIIPRTAFVEEIPKKGYYRFKTNPNMRGDWLISGELKVNKRLSRKEAAALEKESGLNDLPLLPDVIRQKKLTLDDLTQAAVIELKRSYPDVYEKMSKSSRISKSKGGEVYNATRIRKAEGGKRVVGETENDLFYLTNYGSGSVRKEDANPEEVRAWKERKFERAEALAMPGWLKRSIDPEGPTIKDESGTHTVLTEDAELDGKVIVYPTIREIDGELKQLDSEEAQSIAIDNGDYMEVPEGMTGESFSKKISELIDNSRRVGKEEEDDAALGEIAIGNDVMSDASDDFLLNKIRKYHFRRLRDKVGLDVSDEIAKKNLRLLNAAIVLAESSDNFDAFNVDSGAASLYQFIPASAKTAANRIVNAEDKAFEKKPAEQAWESWREGGDDGVDWVTDVSQGSREVMELTPRQQQILFEGDMFQRKGSDSLLPDILRGDTDAMTEYYYKFHHTSPETQPNTKENWERSLEAVQERMSVE